ncbi:hypothetical protein G9A89_013055 [Geosiphon pyriformis]|nr:hypothetical protein G9A89_013055 [Geosiphon pyriformis]
MKRSLNQNPKKPVKKQAQNQLLKQAASPETKKLVIKRKNYIREATFRDAQENIISPPLRPINPSAGNNDKMVTLELKSSILGKVCPVHPNSLPEAVTLARALESAEKKANHSQIVNMIIEENKTEMLEKREEITHTKHHKDTTRNLVAAKIIACYARTSEQKCVPAIFANA